MIQRLLPFLTLIALFVTLSIASPNFLTATNLLRENIFKYQIYPNRPAYAEADGGTITFGIRGSL